MAETIIVTDLFCKSPIDNLLTNTHLFNIAIAVVYEVPFNVSHDGDGIVDVHHGASFVVRLDYSFYDGPNGERLESNGSWND